LARTKKTRPGFLYCPNQACDDRIIELENRDKGLEEGAEVTITDGGSVTVSADGNEICPNCGHEFDPTDGNYGYGKYTCSNGHKHDVKETLSRLDEIPQLEHFALQFIDPRGNKRMKEFDESDAERFEDAQTELAELRDELPIPEQKIPDGDKSGALLNYNYERFDQLFTERHLLTFGLLFKKAKATKNRQFEGANAENIAEFLLTAISNCLERNSKLTMWNYIDSKGENVFRRHAYVPKVQPIEPGIFGSHNASLILTDIST
jgi:adenine-specific DNA methylase